MSEPETKTDNWAFDTAGELFYNLKQFDLRAKSLVDDWSNGGEIGRKFAAELDDIRPRHSDAAWRAKHMPGERAP